MVRYRHGNVQDVRSTANRMRYCVEHGSFTKKLCPVIILTPKRHEASSNACGAVFWAI